MSDSFFKDVVAAPAIEVFQLTKMYNESTCKDKVNLGVGAYRTEEGKPWVLPIVDKTELQIAQDKTLNHEYLPVVGLTTFREAAARLILGPDSKVITENKFESFQALGGTGALCMSAFFLKTILGFDTVYVSNPTWGNHKGIFKGAGFSTVKDYRYFDKATCSLDLKGMLEDLSAAPDNAVVILHAVAHNPTGVDPTKEEWKQIQKLCAEKNFFVVMDIAYQGFASGNLEDDAWAVRFFAEQGMEMFVAQSFSKNFGLYNERVGNCLVVCKDSSKLKEIRSQMEILIRIKWSNPSNHGALIVGTVLNNQTFKNEWKEQVATMANRIKQMRQLLFDALKKLGTPGTWDHITKQIGMFSYTGLSEQQVEFMIKDYHIYLLKSGRISVSGLTANNVDYVAKAMDAAVRAFPSN